MSDNTKDILISCTILIVALCVSCVIFYPAYKSCWEASKKLNRIEKILNHAERT